MALNIKDPETDRLVRELARLTGEKITDAVRSAVLDKLDRERRRRQGGSLDRIGAIVAAFNAKPVVDPRLPEAMLCDEDGMPR
ncbi:MAG: type II toxin-antitoxin system VapB family antitoxin [Geminicoccaceae bacterium]